MRLSVEHQDSTDVVMVTIRDPKATVRDLAAALSLSVTDVLAIDHVPYDSEVKLSEIGIANGSVVSMAEALQPEETDRRFWVGVVNGPGTGSLVTADPGATVSIGRGPGNDLAIDNTTVSQRHARIHFDDAGGIELEDLGSHNGTWVDGRSLTSRTSIEVGQLVRLGSSMVSIQEVDLGERTMGMSTRHADPTGRVLLNRPPRPPLLPPPPTIALPAAIENRSGPTLAVVTLVAPLVFACVMVVALGSWRYALFGLLSPVLALGNWLSGRRRVGRERKNDGRLHADAIARLRNDLEGAEHAERQRRRSLGPDILELRRRITLPTRQLWERRGASADALTVRLGIGESPWDLQTDMVPSSDEVEGILEKTSTLDEIELIVDLREGPVGLVGDREVASDAVRGLLIQLATHHGPADVRIAVLTRPDRIDGWRWIQWLPHSTAGDGSTHLLVGANATEFASGLSLSMESLQDRGDSVTWVLVVDDLELIHGRSSPVRRALATGENVVGLVIAETEDALPASVANVVRIEDADGVFSLHSPSTPTIGSSGVLGLLAEGIANDLARALARFEDPEEVHLGGSLPGLVSAQDLFGSGLDGSAVRRRWRANENDPALATTIGIASSGPFELDLVADGPHALVAGTTGAGKSELLRTLVVGLSANYEPSQVVFVLIDYKGGSAFDRCAELPHVVGVVTDLDEHLAERALQSLEAELRYREERLRLAGAENIDVYRAAGEPHVSVPRLIVVIDEFATLRNELPGFVDSLVAIAQRGRSLGMHLVLATQRPSGSVDANIRANTNLRIALRVQSSADSTDIIDSASAADISRALPGRAFVRRGEGDLAAVQTGFVSGPAGVSGPPLLVQRPQFGGGQVSDLAGASSGPQLRTANDVGGSQAPSELEGLVAAVVDAGAGRPPVRRPWLDELPSELSPHDLENASTIAGEDGPIAFAIGDDPANQRRVKRCWDPDDGHLAAVGIRGTGVTTTIRSVVAALGVSDLGRDVWVFAVDHAGGGLSGIEAWPHVACCLGATERERHLRLLCYLENELERRRRSTPREVQSMPLLVVAIDGVAAFMEAIDASLGTSNADTVARLGRDGPAVGLSLVVGAERLADMPRALRGQLRRHVLFEQADVNDFAALGLRSKNLPEFVPGRAVLSPDGMVGQIVDWAGGLRADQIVLDRPPPVIEALETRIEAARLSDASVVPTLSIPIGVLETTRTQAVLSLRRGEHATIAGPSGSGRTNALRLVAAQLRRASPELVIVGVTSHEDSSLLDSTALDAGGSLDEIAHVLRMANDDDRRWMVLVDDAERIEVDDGPLVDLARAAPTHVTMIVALRSSAGRSSYGHWTRAVRSSGVGLLLMPDVTVDGELLGARLPGRDQLESVPGRGYLVVAGQANALQLAHA